MIMKILLDTNFLIYVVNSKVDFLSEINRICDFSYELAIPSQVLDEIDKILEKGKGKEKEKAEITLVVLEQLIKEKTIKVIDIQGRDADSAIINLAKKEKIIAATMDRALKKKLNMRIITIRQRSHLQLLGG